MADVKAVTRIEAILNGEDITPVTREEAILSGADVEPLSREEYFVQKRLGEGGGGGGMETATVGFSFASASGIIYAVLNNEVIEELPPDYPRGYMTTSLNANFPADHLETIKGAIWTSNFNLISPAPLVTVTGDITYNSTYGLFVINGDGTITVNNQ